MVLIGRTLAAICAISVFCGQTATASSDWVHPGPGGKMIYKRTAKGDRIMDFSYAGYGEGGVALPDITARDTLAPSGGDDTAAIQAAIDHLAMRSEHDDMPRALLLRAGAFHLSRTVTLPSGVLLRGEGEGANGTSLVLTGVPHLGLQIGHRFKPVFAGASLPLSDRYIASGATQVHVHSDGAIKPGDRVEITAPVTPAWVRFMKMDQLSRNGAAETWLSGMLSVTRTVIAVDQNTVTLVPALSHDYDTRYFGRGAIRMVKIEEPGLIKQVGVEQLRIVAPPRRVTLGQPSYTAIAIDGVKDFWMRNVSIVDMTNDIEIGRYARRGTFEHVTIHHSVAIVGNAKPFAFALAGTQILIDRCTGVGDSIWYVATDRDVQGPNVVLNSRFEGTGAIEPHQRWATGLLVDGVAVPTGRIAFQNRGEMGSGHGWAIGWSVSWNNSASSFLIQQPPGAVNWSIGDVGYQATAPMPTFPQDAFAADEPQGQVSQPGHPVSPKSLYLAQLQERLGVKALRAIGY